MKTMNMQASRVRFLESKVSLLESLLQSAQSMARECGQKAESLQEKKLEKEEALCAMKIVVHEKENEAKKMERSIIDLDGILSVCKRRITEQNENNASLLAQVSIMDYAFKLTVCFIVLFVITTFIVLLWMVLTPCSCSLHMKPHQQRTHAPLLDLIYLSTLTKLPSTIECSDTRQESLVSTVCACTRFLGIPQASACLIVNFLFLF